MEHEETLANMARNTRQGQTNRRTGNSNRRGNVTNNGSGSQAVGGNQEQELGHQEQAAIPNKIEMVQVLQTLAGVVQQQTTIGNNLTRLMEQQQRMQPGVGPQPRPRCNITEFKKIALAFDGATDPLEAEKWLTEMEKLFPVFECTDDQKVTYATFMLQGIANDWWQMEKRIHEHDANPYTWERFKKAFNEKYFPRSVRLQKKKGIFEVRARE
ncbi:uncharacterized protein LOC114289174 [Camellia sinensis]|uniref:uncharacterized protein LOC114289174 n=1 Tax=Camellia sinensis TaxID=4442 RepID=UPI001035A1BB|nr:uncharacterized protein LOC114289174 [Camellia sinensis]